MKINIAIDGPAGSGKSSIAKVIARDLAMTYVDTGSMYRAITWYLLDKKVKVENKIIEELQNIEISFDKNSKVIINGISLKDKIRTIEVTNNVTRIASMQSVRDKLKLIQQNLIKDKNVIMDGRDIGTVIIPDAEFKIYLNASPEIRAKRRYKQLTFDEKNKVSIKNIIKNIKDRDKADMTRTIAPLKKAKDAIEIDTSNMSMDEVVAKIKKIVKG